MLSSYNTQQIQYQLSVTKEYTVRNHALLMRFQFSQWSLGLLNCL